MMNFKKLGIIIQREYLNKVKKKSFLLITFLAPIFFAAIAILPTVIMLGTKEEAKKEEPIRIEDIPEDEVLVFEEVETSLQDDETIVPKLYPNDYRAVPKSYPN